MPELTRATVPMCPRHGCGARVARKRHSRPAGITCHCTACNFVSTGDCDWGYYAPDASGVAAALEAEAHPDHGNCGDWVRVSRFWLRGLADRLKGNP